MKDNDQWGPPIAEEEVEKFREFFSQPAERVAIIIADDLEAECRVEPGTREKVLEHYDEVCGAFGLPKEMVVLEGSVAEATTRAALAIFQCGPSTSPCGPNREDHAWDDEVEFTDGAGRVNGGSLACSRCGLTAMDFDIWNAP